MADAAALIDATLPDLSYALDTCARCGFCKVVCPTHPFGGGFEAYSPRAKVHYLKELREGREELTPEWVDRIYQCTSCERCAEVCQTDIPLVHVWEAARSAAVKLGLGPMPAHKKLRVLTEQFHNPYGEPIEARERWMQPHHRPSARAELLVFAGCTAAYRMPPMLQTGVTILQRQDIPYAYAGGREVCCASPFLRTGQVEMATALVTSNIDLFHELGVKRIVTACGGCSKTLRFDYPELARTTGRSWDFEVLHFSQVYGQLLREGAIRPGRRVDKVVTYHDPCHLGRSQGIYDEPRSILRSIPGLRLLEMEHHREESRCCGAGGGVKANYPEMAAAIARDRVQEAVATGAEVLVTMCPFCQASFAQALKELGSSMRLAGVEELLLESLE
ncbi:MAG TPA: heterodisulfide reductase-related iron-sulfur binding cluster [Anaeromyxobacter sp.]|nr:heterodisulfide reductase-related iron-sulfur binding cluster [Anaeromyxobacter sp.]